jgi:hypothetical protein
VAWADTRAKPGFNFFTVEQDIEIGRRSAAEAERQLPLLNDPSVGSYLSRIVQELAPGAPGASYPYELKAVNASEINAFSLPGGFMYLSRGLFEAARNEAELAGVLAHEMAHVALRHGTHQASKAYLDQAGIGLLGGLLGENGANAMQVVNAIGGVGLNAAFLKFSRDDEYEADEVGAEIMARAGYDPAAMANFFEVLRLQQGRNPGALERWFSGHPPSARREARIRLQARSLAPVEFLEVGGFERMRADLQSLPRASSRQGEWREAARNEDRGTRQVEVRVEPPSSRFERLDQSEGFFSLEHPDNWRSQGSSRGYALTLAPEGGVVDSGSGQQNVVYGIIVNHYDPFEPSAARRRDGLEPADLDEDGSLEEATDDVVRQIIRSNPYLRALGDSRQRERIDGAPTLTVMLSGHSPVTGEEERVTVFARSLPDDHVLYVLCISPGRSHNALTAIFQRILRSLRVNDEAAHR